MPPWGGCVLLETAHLYDFFFFFNKPLLVWKKENTFNKLACGALYLKGGAEG